MSPMRRAVFGTGSWGTAFAVVLADAGNEVRMWGRAPRSSTQINAGTRTADYLPAIRAARGDRGDHATRPRRWTGADIVVLAVPSQTLRANLERLGRPAAARRGARLA